MPDHEEPTQADKKNGSDEEGWIRWEFDGPPRFSWKDLLNYEAGQERFELLTERVSDIEELPDGLLRYIEVWA